MSSLVQKGHQHPRHRRKVRRARRQGQEAAAHIKEALRLNPENLLSEPDKTK